MSPNGRLLVHNFGAGASSYVSPEDCAAATAVLAGGDEHAHRTYDIAGPDALSGADLAAVYSPVGDTDVQAMSVDDAT